MTRTPLRLLLLGGLLAIALFVAACGSDDDNDSASSGDDTTTAVEGKKGGILQQLGSSDVDFIDPGRTYYTGGYQLAYATNRPLYNFKPGQVEPLPDLAEADPEISEDAKTITVKIRDGVKFGPPVDREVTSKDVKYAFERFFSKQVQGQYPGFFSAIEGVPSKLTDGAQDISGITTPDDKTIVFKLSSAQAVSVAAAMVMPITMPIPREYAEPFDAKTPSTYNTRAVASGPYMVKNDAEGNLVGYKAGKSIELVRNPNWDAETDFKPAYLDGVKWTTNDTDASLAAQRVLKGSHLSLDANPPAAELEDAVTNYKGQYQQVPGGGWRYFPLNTTIPPLDNADVRRAIVAAFDRDAARKARGGKLTGDIPTHYLPPGIPGFEEAGGLEGPGIDFMSNPRGDMALAAEYMKKAGYPSGKYTGDEELLLIAANADPGKAQAEVARAQIEKLGFKIKFRVVPQDVVYNEWCQLPKKEVAICGSAGWFKDFTDPQSMLEPTFKGSQIVKDGGLNNNLGQLNDPKIDAAMDKATLLTGDERLKAWAEIDKMITEAAPSIPFLWDKTMVIWSKDVNGVASEYDNALAFAFTSLK